ncbi:MAG: hypothetical protein A2Z88_10995 [Omnitrophica WOR_2 bacterium GWA2_47_8]|nr:MAG: hypothetical protein A2Z88_10995 [Omnitrophica WOR_2 bacterium GWA2_47_8]
MSSWDGRNRRKFPRVNFPCLVKIKYDQGEEEVLLTHTENIGIGGLGVILKKAMKIFTPVDLELDLLDADEHLHCEGKVVWSICRNKQEERKPAFYDTGIEFSNVSEKDQKRINQVLGRLAKNPSFAEKK